VRWLRAGLGFSARNLAAVRGRGDMRQPAGTRLPGWAVMRQLDRGMGVEYLILVSERTAGLRGVRDGLGGK